MPTFQFAKDDDVHSSSTEDWEASLISSSKHSSPRFKLADEGMYMDELASIFNEENDLLIEEEDAEDGSAFLSTDKRWIFSLKPLVSDLAIYYPEITLAKSGSRHLMARTKECLVLLKGEKQKLDSLALENEKLKSIFASLYETLGSFYALFSIPGFELQLDLVALFKSLQSKLLVIRTESLEAQQQLKALLAQQDQRNDDYIRLMNQLSEKEAIILELREASGQAPAPIQPVARDSDSALLKAGCEHDDSEDALALTVEEWQERNVILERIHAFSASLPTTIEIDRNEAQFVLRTERPGINSLAHLIGPPNAAAMDTSFVLSEQRQPQASLLGTLPVPAEKESYSNNFAVSSSLSVSSSPLPSCNSGSSDSSVVVKASPSLTDATALPEWASKYPCLKQELTALCANEERQQESLNRLQSQYDSLLQRQFDIQSENEMLHYQIKSFQLENTLLFEKAQELLLMTFDFKATQIQIAAIRAAGQGSPLGVGPLSGGIAAGTSASASLVPAMNALSVEASMAISRLGSLLKAATATPPVPAPTSAAATNAPSSSSAKLSIESQSVARYVELLKTEFKSTIEALRGNYESALKSETKERIKYQNLYEGLRTKLHRQESASQEGYRSASTQTFFFDTN